MYCITHTFLMSKDVMDINIQYMACCTGIQLINRDAILVSGMWKCQLLSCVRLCNRKDCSPPGSSVRGLLRATILEWVSSPFSRESSQPRDRTWVSLICRQILYCLSYQQSPVSSVLQSDSVIHIFVSIIFSTFSIQVITEY